MKMLQYFPKNILETGERRVGKFLHKITFIKFLISNSLKISQGINQGKEIRTFLEQRIYIARSCFSKSAIRNLEFSLGSIRTERSPRVNAGERSHAERLAAKGSTLDTVCARLLIRLLVSRTNRGGF